MHYQVSRNGQIYGPYTLDDLRRYVASGNVLLTDHAKSEEMADWVPVSQLLNAGTGGEVEGGPRPVGQGNPAFGGSTYGAPPSGGGGLNANPYANAEPAYTQYPDAPDLNWGLYLLLTILTCTLFSRVFTVVQAVWLKRVQPNSNGLTFYIVVYSIWIVSLFVGVGTSLTAFTHPHSLPHISPARILLSVAYWVLLIVTRFVMSASLEEHFNGPEPVGLRLNPVLTFFFGGVYFQYHLNQINKMKQAARYGAGRGY